MAVRPPTRAAVLSRYDRADLRPDVLAGLTVAAMLVPQAMAYALLAGLPPEVGLYSATVPLVVYALLGTSRQLAVGPVAIVSLLTASSLAPLAEEGSADFLAAAAVLALMVGAIHLVLGFGRLGFVVNLLSHSVLVGFTAAAAIIIGFSQVKHLLGISIPRHEHFHDTVWDVLTSLGDTHGTTLALGLASLATLLVLRRSLPRWPAALVVVVGSTLAVALFDLEDRGVRVVGDVPSDLPAFGLPSFDRSWLGTLAAAALVITLVGFMESIAVAKTYARKHRYELDPNRELIGLGGANVAAGLFGGYPVTGGFSRTAVNDTAGARTRLAAVITAALVLLTIAVFTPLFSSLPQAALGAIIVVAVTGLFDLAEMRHVVHVKRTDAIGMVTAFVGTLVLGIELGILVAVVASILVVFARMSMPHSAVLGRLPNTETFRNLDRFPEAVETSGVRVIRVDAAVSFANATTVKALLRREADVVGASGALVLDASGVNDLDATGADMLGDVVRTFDETGPAFHVADVKGPVRDVLHRSGLWDVLGLRVHASVEDAVQALGNGSGGPCDHRASGIDERTPTPAVGRPPVAGPTQRQDSSSATRADVDPAGTRPADPSQVHTP